MIDNELIEKRLKKKKRHRRILVTIETIIIVLLFAGIIYYMAAVRPAVQSGHPEQAIPSFLRNYLDLTEAEVTPEPTRLPTPTPTSAPTPTATPTATPTPEPTLAPEIEALRLPGFDSQDPDDWNLILVNQAHPIPDDYTFELAYVDEEKGFTVDERIADPLQQMLEDCSDAGLNPEICSAYRDTDTQTYLYDEDMGENIEDGGYWDADTGEWVSLGLGHWDNETGEWIPFVPDGEGYWDPDTEKWVSTEPEDPEAGEEESYAVAAPGTSEHELGLAVDIFSEENTILDESQEKSKTQKWLMEHCWEYGFILRYPKDKSEITGIIYEPWHYRYVGVDAAKDITENDLCLEEYLEQMQIVKEAEAAL